MKLIIFEFPRSSIGFQFDQLVWPKLREESLEESLRSILHSNEAETFPWFQIRDVFGETQFINLRKVTRIKIKDAE